MRVAHQNHFGRRMNAHQPAEGPQRFGNPFVRLQETEDADQRRGLVQPQTFAKLRAVGVRNPGAMLDASHGARESRAAQLSLHAAAMHDGRLGSAQQLAQHRHAFVVRPHFEAPHAIRIRQVRGAALLLDGAHVGVPVATLDGDVGDQVMKIGFVHHDDAGMIHRRLITKVVINVVAHLVQRDVEILRVKGNRLRREHLHVHQLFQFVEKCGGIIGNAAARGGKRGEESYFDGHEYVGRAISPVPSKTCPSPGERAPAPACAPGPSEKTDRI